MVLGVVLAAHAVHEFLLGVVEFLVGARPRDVVLIHSLQLLPCSKDVPPLYLSIEIGEAAMVIGIRRGRTSPPRLKPFLLGEECIFGEEGSGGDHGLAEVIRILLAAASRGKY